MRDVRKFDIICGGIAFLALIGLGMWGCPNYKVWEQDLEGKAELAKATQNRRIKTLEAEAKRDSAKLEADAEVARARGLAEANQILGQSLAGENGERYLRYLWVVNLEKGESRETIYVPTEAGLPILEATRRRPVVAAPAN